MKRIAYLLVLTFGMWPALNFGQVLEEGEIKDYMRLGRHVWKDQTGQIKAEVTYDAHGVVASFRTWDDRGLLMDDMRLDAKRERFAYPDLSLTFEPDGFGFMIIQANAAEDAPAARQGERVAVYYQGTLQDGTIFDGNFGAKKPFRFKFQMGEVVEGFDRAVSMLKVGQEGYFWMPSKLAYGANVVGEIPPFSDLIFRIKLVDLN